MCGRLERGFRGVVAGVRDVGTALEVVVWRAKGGRPLMVGMIDDECLFGEVCNGRECSA